MAAGYGLAVLSGLLGGSGSGLARGMQQGDEMALQRERLAEQQRQFDESRFTDLSSLAPILKAGGYDPSALPAGKVQRELVPTILQLGNQKAEQARKAQLGQDISRQLIEQGTSIGMAPGASISTPEPGDLLRPTPPAAPMRGLTEPRVDPKMAALARLVPGLLQADPAAATALIKDAFIPPKPILRGPDQELVNPTTGAPIGEARPAPSIPEGMVPSSMTRGGVTYKVPGEGKANLSQGVAEVLQAQGINPVQATPAQIDAAIATVQARLDKRATLGATVIKPPDSEILQKGAQANEVITLGMDLINRFKTNPNVKPGLGARLGEMELPFGARPSDVIGQTQTDEQRKWIADVTALIGTYRALKSGLAVTKSEAEYSLPIVPMNPGAVLPQQIEALVDWGRRNKIEMDRALIAAKKLPLPPSSPPATPPPAGAPRGEILSRRDPRYQKLRQRGLTDQQIQQQFGVTVAD